ncbi:sperm-associated antigen 1 isoform X2 [Drosophila novamexicana]|uniref:sperm-associated antigen 1 isoform X1 n=1 Tax=Drosophila novamexicana TaxID=47314 RepID=UPI0011E6074A|nr:sperm-associated antigen 1 isoform X1 [Drosophila novamexicana]XP_030573542.1 sperm-associated antigen 1 isoform X2 [Drosophila novamexicana]
MEKSKTLLEKYQIPINHLDFAYVEKCQNAREMEKIVMILRSGEEGYFPDLTRCAEEKLKQLKPDSKLFRIEEQIRSSNMLDKQELKPIYDWTNDIKNKDSALNELKEESAELATDLPPVRKPCKIEIDKEESETQNSGPVPKPNAKPQLKSTNEERIKSTDYNKWDKYDPDEEILRMDLEEERSKEHAKIKLRKTETTTKEEHIKICEKGADEQRLQAQLKKLSQIEREQYAEKYRLRGNEYFKAKEYDNAIEEYTLAIVYDPARAARAYNNRAVSYLKKKNYLPAIDDCEACLRLEPDNVKALLRLADANYGQGRRRESYGFYQRVLALEPNNISAKKALDELRQQLGELAPAHATRMIIEELQSEKAAADNKPKTQAKPQPKQVQSEKPPKDYDLAELVKPNRVIKSKIACAAEALGGTLKTRNPVASAQKEQLQQMMQGVSTAQAELRLPQSNKSGNNNKLLIQEIL